MKTIQILTTLLAMSIASQCFGAGMSQKDQEKAAVKRFIQDIKTAQAQFNEKRAQAIRSEAQSIIPYLATLSEEDKAIALSEIEQLMTFFKPVKTEPMRKRETAIPQERPAAPTRIAPKPVVEQAPIQRPAAPTRVAPKPVTIEEGAAAKSAEQKGKVMTPIVQPSKGYSRRGTVEQPMVQRAAVQKFVKPKPKMPSRKAPKRPEEVKKEAAVQQVQALSEKDKLLRKVLMNGMDLEVEAALKLGGNPNTVNDGAPIFWTIFYGYPGKQNFDVSDADKLINVLARYGANILATLPDGKTILHHAAMTADFDKLNTSEMEEFMESLSKDAWAGRIRGKEAHEIYKKETRKAITEKFASGAEELIEALIKKGLNINARDNQGNTPLHYAASSFDTDYLIEPLLKNGANINARNNKGETPLLAAVKRPSKRLKEALNPNSYAIELLLENNADPFVHDNAGKEALDYIDPSKVRKQSKKRFLKIKKMLDDYTGQLKKSTKELARQPITAQAREEQRAQSQAEAKAAGRRKEEIVEIPGERGIRDIVGQYLFGEEEKPAAGE